MNKKNKYEVFTISANPAVFKEIMPNVCDKMQEYLDAEDEDLTVESLVEQFKYELNGMISKRLMTSFGIDIEAYYESHNNQITIDILQSMIDEENQNG